MFSKQQSPEQKAKKIDSEAISSIIDSTMKLTGEIAFRGKARIDGTIEGNIDGEHLVLSETGIIKGDIIAETCNCFGRVEGNIKAEMLTARKNCQISGKIEAQSLTVEPGATITGEINAAAMKKPSTIAQPDSSATAS